MDKAHVSTYPVVRDHCLLLKWLKGFQTREYGE